MSTDAQPVPHRVHRPRRWVLWVLVGLVAAAGVGIGIGIGVGIDRAFFSGQAQYSWPPEPCVVQGIDARCGTFVVPENRAKPNGRTIGLHVVVLPAFLKPARKDAVTYLAGGPGDAATEHGGGRSRQLVTLNLYRDILLVDQRGTGRSSPHGGDVTQYGTRMAMDDLDAVRAALGYRQLDVIGSSYGATAAQIYLKLHPRLGAHAHPRGRNRDRRPLLRPLRRQRPARPRPAREPLRLAIRLPEGVPGLGAPVRRARQGMERPPGERHDGRRVRLRRPVMLLDLDEGGLDPARRQPRRKRATTRPSSERAREISHVDLNLMGSSIWCNEPWTGLDAKGPWGTDFDSYTTARIAAFRHACCSVPKRAEPRPLWTLPASSRVPVLALVGGADPQDPVTNLSDLKQHFPDSRTVIFPHIGHQFSIGGCVDPIMADFVDRGTTKGLDTTRCYGAVLVPPFDLPD